MFRKKCNDGGYLFNHDPVSLIDNIFLYEISSIWQALQPISVCYIACIFLFIIFLNKILMWEFQWEWSILFLSW